MNHRRPAKRRRVWILVNKQAVLGIMRNKMILAAPLKTIKGLLIDLYLCNFYNELPFQVFLKLMRLKKFISIRSNNRQNQTKRCELRKKSKLINHPAYQENKQPKRSPKRIWLIQCHIKDYANRAVDEHHLRQLLPSIAARYNNCGGIDRRSSW